MRVSLIGMSNAGKSYLSKKLEEIEFFRFCCDDLIEKKLEKELKRRGYSGIHDVARWMGQPFDKQYQKTSTTYLSFETEVMQEILTRLDSDDFERDLVVDTTASVIYAGNSIMETLAKKTTVVYLDTPESVKQKMYQSYISNPKPVIWGGSFNKKRGESDMEALARCYPDLLTYRTTRYKKYAQITLEYNFHRRSNFRLTQLLDVIHTHHSRLLL